LKFVACVLLAVAQIAGQSPQSSFILAAAQRSGSKPESFSKKICDFPSDPIAGRVLREYGAIFVAGDSVRVPTQCIFQGREAVDDFHSGLKLSSAKIRETEITLQSEALRALLDAVDGASEARLRITPLDGTIAGTRNYDDTVRLWNSPPRVAAKRTPLPPPVAGRLRRGRRPRPGRTPDNRSTPPTRHWSSSCAARCVHDRGRRSGHTVDAHPLAVGYTPARCLRAPGADAL